MSFNKMINFWTLICVFSSTMVGIHSINFCDDNTTLDSIFTMGEYTYAKKGDLYFQTKVGQTLKAGRYQPMDNLFKKGQTVKFRTIDTGFMVTKTPNCSTVPENETEICENQGMLENKVFVIGMTAEGDQSYITYVYESITGSYETLTPVSSNGELPSYMKFEDNVAGAFWPTKDNAEDKIVRSTFDERSSSIVHIVIHKNGTVSLFTYSLLNMEETPEFQLSTDEETIRRLNEETLVLGFFKMPPKDDSERNIYTISKSRKVDNNIFIFYFDINFRFDPFPNGVDFEHIYGCYQSVTTTTTQKTTPPGKPSIVTTTTQPSVPGSVTTSPDSDDGNTGDDGITSLSPTDESESSSVWIVILVVIVIGIIILISIISALLYYRQNKEKPVPIKDDDLQRTVESDEPDVQTGQMNT